MYNGPGRLALIFVPLSRVRLALILVLHCWIKEAIVIRETTPIMNPDEGGYRLNQVWDGQLAKSTLEEGCHQWQPKR